MTRRTRYGLDIVAIAAAYFALARLGLLFTLSGTKVSLVWLPAGVALSALLIFGTSRWPAIALGELALMLSLGYAPGVALVAATANAAQALAGAYLLRHVVHLELGLERQRDVLGLLATALVSSAAGATIAVVGFGLIGRFPWQTSAGVWRSWWMGDVIGILLVTPAALTWRSRAAVPAPTRRLAEAAVMAVVLFALAYAVFVGIPGRESPIELLPYLIFPLLVWSALRFQQRGATSVVLLVSAFAIWATAHGYGPLVRDTPSASLLDMDGFIAVAALTTMLLAAVVAEQQRAARVLLESESVASAERERFRALVERGSDIVAMTDGDSRLLYVSPSVTRILGYSPEELIGERGLSMVHPEDLASAKAHIAEVLLRPGGSVTQTLRVRHKDGTWRHVEVERVNRLDDPSVGALVTNLRDLTERKRLEDQLLSSHRMEAVGRLAGGVAHDFNNILTAILGNAELMKDELPPDHPAAADLEEIRAAAVRATALTRQLLAFSRKQVLQPKVLDLNEVIGGMEKMLRRLIGENFDLVLERDPALARVRADPGQLEQVILNLALNARDSMPMGGPLTVVTETVDLDADYAAVYRDVTPGSYAMVAVTDTGTGMDADTLSHLFEPFFSTKSRDKGTGLGLATAYGIVKQSGGHIRVNSVLGRGSVFKVYLPAVEEEEDAPPAEPAGAPRRGTETVLLAEDDAALRALSRRVLERCGYLVLEAASGEAALTMAGGHGGKIGLLLTDVVMPGMSGRRLAEQMMLIRRDTRVLYMSGYTDDAVIEQGVLADSLAFIQKPFTPDGLARKVREVLDS